jgi:hypothetical protein
MEVEDLMEDRSLFISSCSRRELARRRPMRSVVRIQVVLALLVLAAALAALILARGGV